ncbi:hypothetical protein A2U01_0109759, partial [Trifolium medium]|nr:hypothetical protein [Trifolium medium]
MKSVNCAQLRRVEPGAGMKKLEGEVLATAPGMGGSAPSA